MHSTRLLARHTPRNTSRTRPAKSCQWGTAFASWTVRANAQARVAAEPGVDSDSRQAWRCKPSRSSKADKTSGSNPSSARRRCAWSRNVKLSRRRNNRLGLLPIVEAAFGREELEGGSAQLPGPLGGQRLIPKPLGLTPQAACLCGVARPRFSRTAQPVQLLLGRLGSLQGAAGRAPGFPQGTATLAERVKDVQRILEIRLSFGATSGTLQLQPLAQAAAIVPDDAAERRKPGEFHSPRLAIAGCDHSSPDPTQAAGFDEHQDRFGPKKISSAVACLTLGWATSSSTSSNWPARWPASSVARPNVGTLGVVTDPATTCNSRRATLRLTPSAWATLANSSCLSRVISMACSSRSWRSWI